MENENQNLETQPQVQANKIEPKFPVWKSKYLLIGVGIVILLFLVGGGYYLGRGSILNEMQPKGPIAPPPDEPHAPTATPTPAEDIFENLEGGSTRYTSPALGITFNVINEKSGEKSYITRNGNKVCVSYEANDENCQKGQSVEIFSKKPSQSLADAIYEQILSGVSKDDCFVTTSLGKTIISFPHNESGDGPWWDSPSAQKCPAKYSETNGLRYFYSDPNVADKFAFFNIGQYAIFSDMQQKTTWQDTFKFTQ